MFRIVLRPLQQEPLSHPFPFLEPSNGPYDLLVMGAGIPLGAVCE